MTFFIIYCKISTINRNIKFNFSLNSNDIEFFVIKDNNEILLYLKY